MTSRVQLALRVPDLTASVAFYTKLFGTEPAKLRDGYANFAIAEPPLKLVLIEGTAGESTRMDHLGVEVDSTEAVRTATTRLTEGRPAHGPGERHHLLLRRPGQGLGPRPRPGTLGGVRRQVRRRHPDQAADEPLLRHPDHHESLLLTPSTPAGPRPEGGPVTAPQP